MRLIAALALFALAGLTVDVRVFDAVNREREAQGLTALQWDSRLAEVARAHSMEMARKRYISHDDPDSGGLRERLAAGGVRWRACAENLYVVYGPPFEVRRAVTEWLRSPGHRRNIVNRVYTHAGVGMATARGDTYVTEIFAAY